MQHCVSRSKNILQNRCKEKIGHHPDSVAQAWIGSIAIFAQDYSLLYNIGSEQVTNQYRRKQIMNTLQQFANHLYQNEKSAATIEKYLHNIKMFLLWLNGREITKERSICYKKSLSAHYKAASVNAMLAGINGYLTFVGKADCRVKPLRIQRTLFSDDSRELSIKEYSRLVHAAAGAQISYVMQTICSTGIRVSELRYITAEAVREGRVTVRSKGKTRIIFLPVPLRKLLLSYMKKTGVTSGCVFLTKNKKPLSRNAVWRSMKALCKRAGVEPRKVFPHSLRHLFARVFYSMEKDLLRLADILGHTSVNTTRIYTMESGEKHIQLLEHVSQMLLAT